MKLRYEIEMEIDSNGYYRAWIVRGPERIRVKSMWTMYPSELMQDARRQRWQMRLSRWK